MFYDENEKKVAESCCKPGSAYVRAVLSGGSCSTVLTGLPQDIVNAVAVILVSEGQKTGIDPRDLAFGVGSAVRTILSQPPHFDNKTFYSDGTPVNPQSDIHGENNDDADDDFGDTDDDYDGSDGDDNDGDNDDSKWDNNSRILM